MKRDNGKHMRNTRLRRIKQGLCQTCGGEKERKYLKNCNLCIEKCTEGKRRSRLRERSEING